MDAVIIGAGIVGLSVAYQLTQSNPHLKILILEKEDAPAKHQTGRNSGVIHSGIYYKPGSLKAKNCLSGKKTLLEFCQQFTIPTKKLGKVIVATEPTEIPRLNEIEQKGRANGIPLQRISPSQLKEIEPHVTAIDAIWIPECSIVSYAAVAQKLAAEFQRMGGEIAFSEPVLQIQSIPNAIQITSSKREIQTPFLINCAGLFSDRIAKMALGKSHPIHQILPFRGEYYELSEEKKGVVNGLVYPVPDPRFPFLGVHLTPMINGKVEAGPNAILAFAREGYKKRDVNFRDCLDFLTYPGFWKMGVKYWKAGFYEMARSFSKSLFLKDLQKLVPSIQKNDLTPGGAGIRAQVVTPEGKLVDDFSILQTHNMIHVLNAPSPAATASFSIGKEIAERFLKGS